MKRFAFSILIFPCNGTFLVLLLLAFVASLLLPRSNACA